MLELGCALASKLCAGNIVAIEGPLGAGKTTLVRGVLRGLGFEGDVPSPTYNLVFEHPTVPPVIHADLYRLESAMDVAELGLFEPDSQRLMLIEWPERAAGLLPKGVIKIIISHESEGRRVRCQVSP